MSHSRAWLVAAMSLLVGTLAEAQDMINGPVYEEEANQPRRGLVISGTISTAYDTNLGADFGLDSTGVLPPRGMFTLASGGATYSRPIGATKLDTGFGSSVRRYRSANTFTSTSHYWFAAVTRPLARRTVVSVGETLRYGSTFSLLPTTFASTAFASTATRSQPTQLAAEGLDEGLTDSRILSSQTSATINRQLTRRFTLALNGSLRLIDLSAIAMRDQAALDVGGQLNYRLNRNATLEFGYTYLAGDYGFSTSGGGRPSAHDIRVGVAYDRPLSLSRRTTIDFNVGSSLHNRAVDPLEVPGNRRGNALLAPEQQSDERLDYRMTGDVTLRHRVARSWGATLAYQRMFGLTEGLGAALFSDRVSLALSGSLIRMLEVGVSGAYTTGEALTVGTPQFKTYFGSAHVQVNASRTWAVRIEGIQYFYDFSNNAAWIQRLPSILERASLRATLALRFPLIGR